MKFFELLSVKYQNFLALLTKIPPILVLLIAIAMAAVIALCVTSFPPANEVSLRIAILAALFTVLQICIFTKRGRSWLQTGNPEFTGLYFTITILIICLAQTLEQNSMSPIVCRSIAFLAILFITTHYTLVWRQSAKLLDLIVAAAWAIATLIDCWHIFR